MLFLKTCRYSCVHFEEITQAVIIYPVGINVILALHACMHGYVYTISYYRYIAERRCCVASYGRLEK